MSSDRYYPLINQSYLENVAIHEPVGLAQLGLSSDRELIEAKHIVLIVSSQ